MSQAKRHRVDQKQQTGGCLAVAWLLFGSSMSKSYQWASQ
jgi:hypothetical protein